jgi:hypothetical protein
LENKGLKAAGREPVGHLAAFKVRGKMGVGPSGQHHHSRTVFVPALRSEDGKRGNVFAGFPLCLGRVTRPQANGLDAEERIVFAGGRAGLFFGNCRDAKQQTRAYERGQTLQWKDLDYVLLGI